MVVFSLLVNLGVWQLNRGDEKQVLEQQLIHRSAQKHQPLHKFTEFSSPVSSQITGLKVSTSFSFTELPLVYLDNQIHQGRVGYLIYQIVKPHQQDQHLLIELGFIDAGYDRSVIPKVTQKPETNTVTGRLYSRSSNPLSANLMPEFLSQIRIQNLNIQQLESALNISLLPFALQPDNLKNWPLPQPWKPLPMASSKHYGYSFQWFVMAGVWLSLMSAFFIRKYRAIKKDLV